MKSWMLIFLPLLILIASCSQSEQVSGPAVQTIDFIVKDKLGSNLSSMAKKVAERTQTYQMIKFELGASETDKLIAIELGLTIEKYQDEWNQNLANAYSEFLTIEEINSLYYNGKHSPYFDKQLKLNRKIGASMQNKSKELLTKVVSEAVSKAFKKVPA